MSKGIQGTAKKTFRGRFARDATEISIVWFWFTPFQDLKKSNVRDPSAFDKKSKQLERLKEQLKKLELQETDRDENKTIALGTSKLNYLDPRISVAW